MPDRLERNRPSDAGRSLRSLGLRANDGAGAQRARAAPLHASRVGSPGGRPTAIGPVYVVTPGGTRAKGGIGRMVGLLARSWSVPDAPLTVIDSYGPGARALMPLHFAGAFARLAVACALGRVGLLHVHMSERASVLRKGLVIRLGRLTGVPTVLHLHGADFADYCRALPPARLRAVRAMMAEAGAVVALGQYWREFSVSELGLDPARVTVLPNAVAGPDEVPERPSEGPCRLLFLGVVGERKGVPTLLEALAAPALRALPWRLVLAGNGEIEPCRALAGRLGLSERVEFRGWVDEAASRRLLAESDLLVLPSRNEGLPMAILEAMAYGLPVVATPVGAVADAVEDGVTGLLVPPGEAAALAGALARLIADPRLRADMGGQARARHLRDFTLDAFNARLERIYRGAAR